MLRRGKAVRLDDRPGAVLVLALLLMAIMSIIGTTAIMTSTTDIQISQNTKVSRQAFYSADAGVEMAPKFVRSIVDAGAVPAVNNVTLDAGLLNEVMGFTAEDDADFPTSGTPDVQQAMSQTAVDVDIDRTGTGHMTGSGVEFGAGAEGAGVGAGGGVLIFFTFDAVGTAPSNAQSRVDVYYRYVVGVAGGK